MLISQPGSDYQLAQITLDAGHARDIMLMLLDIHAVLDQLHLDGTQPQITATAEAILRESGSPYTLPALINALGEVINQLTRMIRDAAADISPPRPNHPASFRASGGAKSECNKPRQPAQDGAKSKYNSGAKSG